MNPALIIPTLNDGPDWETVLSDIDVQTWRPDQKILLDSCSTDRTAELAEKQGFEIHSIQPEAFNHCLIHQVGANLCPDADILIFITQDTVPTDLKAFETLLECFQNPQIPAAYRHQLPRPTVTHRTDSGKISKKHPVI